MNPRLSDDSLHTAQGGRKGFQAMQVNIKDRQEVEATVEVTLPAAEVDGAFASVLRELSGRVRIPGFRPGKVPAAILEKRIGAEALAQEVREMLIDGNYREA